jgi:hypothetical protein
MSNIIRKLIYTIGVTKNFVEVKISDPGFSIRKGYFEIRIYEARGVKSYVC